VLGAGMLEAVCSSQQHALVCFRCGCLNQVFKDPPASSLLHRAGADNNLAPGGVSSRQRLSRARPVGHAGPLPARCCVPAAVRLVPAAATAATRGMLLLLGMCWGHTTCQLARVCSGAQPLLNVSLPIACRTSLLAAAIHRDRQQGVSCTLHEVLWEDVVHRCS
jgi:hypothetical protein